MNSTKKKEETATVPQNLDPQIKTALLSVQRKNADLPAKIATEEEYNRIEATQSVTYALIQNIKSWYKKHKDPIAKALKALRDEESLLLQEPEAWHAAARVLMGTWYAKKEEEAEKARRLDQRRLDAEAEAARKRELAALKKSGDKEAAEELRAVPVIAAVAEISNAAELDHRTFRDDFEVTVLDLLQVPDEYIKRELRLAEVKTALKNGVSSIPGLAFKKIKVLVNR